MSRKRNKTNNNAEVNTKQVEEPLTAPVVLYAIKLEVVGAEEINVVGVSIDLVQKLHQWFSGLGHSVTELSVEGNMLVLDRSKIAYMVISEQTDGDKNEG